MNLIDNGVTFRNIITARITTGGFKIAKGKYKQDAHGNIVSGMPAINAIDIDWCNAQIPGIDDPITSTGQLLSIIGEIKQIISGSICDCPKFITITAEEYEALETYEEDTIYFILGDSIDDGGDESDEFDANNVTTNLYVNGVQHLESGVQLPYGGTYTISGTLRGTITITVPQGTTPENYTNLILNNVTIVSDEDFAIKYQISEGATQQKGISITIEKNSFNRLVCLKEQEIADDQAGAIYSMNNLEIQGAGYLAIQNKGGHGIRGKETKLANLHLWCDASHDGVHGKNISIIGGTYYFDKCNDAFGTTDNLENQSSGHILFYDGQIKYRTLNGQLLDSKKFGLYFNDTLISEEDLLKCNNMNLLTQESYNTYVGKSTDAIGNIIAYDNREDYKDMSNGTLLDLQNITQNITYGEGASAITAQVYVITNPYISINGYLDKPIYFTPDIFGTVNASVKLNNAYLTNNGHMHTMLYGASTGNVHIFSVQDTINIIENTYVDINKVQLECDAVKSENNIEVESKGGSTLYITSVSTDGLDGGEIRITDSKGDIVISGCGQRGIKGNAVVIGPNAVISKSSISSYYTNPSDTNNYTTFDGICYVKNNCKVCQPQDLTGDNTESSYDEHNTTGFADIFARNGKSANKGAFGTTNNELKGYLITGSMGAVLRMDFGNADRLYYNDTFESEHYNTTFINNPGASVETDFSYDLNHQKHGN